MKSGIKFPEIREMLPSARGAALAGIAAEARTPANGSVEALNVKIAAELGVSSGSLGRWIKQHEIDAGEREGLSTSSHSSSTADHARP
ncbi:MAG: hypothetical protein M3534_07005 [Actinomycetota bacterium]|jgi:transposase-like protein|nr:hypothetical protein [Actinomycetota bacterium]